jgi:hypothetical protein
MLRNPVNGLVLLLFFALVGWASAADAPLNSDVVAGVKPPVDQSGNKIYKVKPATPQVYKVKPEERFDPISRFSPFGLMADCCFPSPVQGQFTASASVMFARVHGKVSKGGGYWAGPVPDRVDFEDHLKLTKGVNPVVSMSASYQIQPRWALRYTLTPISIDASTVADVSFSFRGQSFSAGTTVRSKWERFEHRAGLVFNLSRTVNSSARVFAEWMYIQDRVSIGQAFAGVVPAIQWDDDKNMAVMGLEIDKCIKNFRGSTLAISCKGGIAFLGDHIGYEAEAGLSYLVPVRQGSFGFIKGGYRYATLKKERDAETFSTSMDGAFIQAGFFM